MKKFLKKSAVLPKKNKVDQDLINNKKKNNARNKISTQNFSSEERLKKLEERYLQGRQEYLNLFRESPVALVYTDIDGIVRYANRCFEELTGFLEEELKGQSLAYCLKPEDHTFLETNNNTSFETVVSRSDNTRLLALINRTYNQVDNRLAGMIFSFQDISFLKKERRIRQTLYQISQLTHSDLPLPEIYPLVHEQLKKIIVATNFYIALWDSKQQQFNFPYYTDEASGNDELFIQNYSTTQSIFHYVLKIGKPVLMDFQRYRKMLSLGYIQPWDVMTNTHLWLAVPLKLEHKIRGVLALQSYDNARLYSERDIDLLEFVAQQLSGAIYRKEKEEELASIDQKIDQKKEYISNPERVSKRQFYPTEHKDFYNPGAR
jgi:PAS domain S-box-containing protein